MKRKSDKLEVIRYLLGLHEFGHVSPRRYKLHDFLKIKKDELSPKKVETNHLS